MSTVGTPPAAIGLGRYTLVDRCRPSRVGTIVTGSRVQLRVGSSHASPDGQLPHGEAGGVLLQAEPTIIARITQCKIPQCLPKTSSNQKCLVVKITAHRTERCRATAGPGWVSTFGLVLASREQLA